MPNTITDFWRMIWEHKLNTIIMLTKPVEKSKVEISVCLLAHRVHVIVHAFVCACFSVQVGLVAP